jgi:hypothetical protein
LSVFSQEDTIRIGNWMIQGKVSFNVSQAYFSNWAAGGISNFTTIGKYTMIANYKKDKHSFDNYLDLALGYTIFLEGEPMKTEDKIEYITAYRYQLHKNWYFSVMGKFASQFAPGYEYDIDSTTYVSTFLAPAWIDVGPGITYQPVDWFWVNLSPINPAFIVVNDQRLANEGIFGLEPAEVDTAGNVIKDAAKVKYMFGAKLTTVLNYEIVKNVNVGTKLELFSDYLNNPQNLDVNWQVLIGLKVNDWLNVDLQTTLLYDDDIMITDADGNTGPRTQFRQLLLISVGYAF